MVTTVSPFIPPADISRPAESSVSAVSWPAIAGGAVVAAAVSLALVLLGSALGLAAVSPWSASNPSVTSITIKTVVWLIVMQWVASAFGGYLTGRLRTKWAGLHSDEVFFRDTAHGFLTWAVATVITAAFLASATSAVVGGGTQLAATVASGAAAGASQAVTQNKDGTDPTAYYVDSLFRSDTPNAAVSDRDVRAETTRILITGSGNGEVPAADRTYLAHLVAARTGLAPADASKRVDDVIARIDAAEAKAREAAEKARKTAMQLSFFTFLSLLIGAFIASVAAALGGTHRDEY